MGALHPPREKGTREGSLGIRQQTEDAAGAQELVLRELEGAEGGPPWMPNLDAQPVGHARSSRPAEGLPGKLTNAVGSQGTCGKAGPPPDSVLGADQVPSPAPAAPSSLLGRAQQSSRWPAGAMGDGPPALLPRNPNGKDLSVTP